MTEEKQQRKRVLLAGPDESVLLSQAYPAFRAAGYEIGGAATTPDTLRGLVGAGIDLLVIDVSLAPSANAAVELLSEFGTPMAVILPPAWSGEQKRFAALNLTAGFTGPVKWAAVAANLKERVGVTVEGDAPPPSSAPTPPSTPAQPSASPSPSPPSSPPSPPAPEPPSEPDEPERAAPVVQVQAPSGVGPTVRIGFCGNRGGVGTSTAALTAARHLVAEGKRVALFDAARRGDLHVMSGVRPVEKPVRVRGLALFTGEPTEDAIRGYDAVVVDGGRQRRDFNARWVAVTKPLSENKVRGLVGLAPLDDDDEDEKGKEKEKGKGKKRGKKGGKRSLDLGSLISIEVSD